MISSSESALLFNQADCLVRIVDDEPSVRSGIGFLLSAENWRSFGYSSAEAFLEQDNPNVPGCLILDVRLEKMNGLALQVEMKRRGLHLPIIFISAHGEMDMAVRTMQYGAVDFLAKPVDPERLLKAVTLAAKKDFARHRREIEVRLIAARWRELTPREKDVALLLRRGALNKQIAAELGIAERTVQSHRSAVLQKLGVKTTVELDRLIAKMESSVDEDQPSP